MRVHTIHLLFYLNGSFSFLLERIYEDFYSTFIINIACILLVIMTVNLIMTAV